MPISRRLFLQGTAAAAGLIHVRGSWGGEAELSWHDVTAWGVEGRGWEDQERKRYFDRFPAKAEKMVREAVWSLSRHSAGMAVHFRTNARTLHVDYELLSDSLAMPHMPATGVSGLDLYAQHDPGPPRWLQVMKPTGKRVTGPLVQDLDGQMRDYTVYLPLYNGVDSLKIGVPAGSDFQPIPPRRDKPILFYGTSIMHGACASRPGMAIPAILGRRLRRPTINLGFSGNGRMEMEVAELLAEVDAAAYCIDCLPNMNPEQVRARAVPLVRRLREARPATPIVLVEDREFTNAVFFPEKLAFHRDNRRALRDAYESLVSGGVNGLLYLPGTHLLGDDGEAATDGSHPSDLGFLRYAAAYEEVLRPLLS